MGLLSLFTSLLKENHFLFLSAVCWMGPRELMMRSVPPCKKSSNKRKEALLQFNCLSSSHWHLIINLHCHCGTDYLNLFFLQLSHFSKCKYNLTHLIKIFKVYFFWILVSRVWHAVPLHQENGLDSSLACSHQHAQLLLERMEVLQLQQMCWFPLCMFSQQKVSWKDTKWRVHRGNLDVLRTLLLWFGSI